MTGYGVARSGVARAGPTRIAVVDYGAGNLVSIEQALRAAGADVVRARHAGALAEADALVVPGVGAAAPAMARLRRGGLDAPIRAWIADGRPLLGICLGLQLLFDGSDEDGAVTLGVLPGRTIRLADAPRLPHIGWNQVERTRPHPLFAGIAEGADFYFVHSYAASPGPAADGLVLAETAHGGRFVSAIARGSLAGVQFHPERSGRDGLRLLANFVELTRASTLAARASGATSAAAGAAATASGAAATASGAAPTATAAVATASGAAPRAFGAAATASGAARSGTLDPVAAG